MSKVRVTCFSVSLDGYGAGRSQDLANPLGVDGEALHDWMFPTQGDVDANFVRRAKENVGAWIMSRNMFGPIRGAWPDDAWRGWWGDDPPFHVPVFVLTHQPRASIAMAGGTTFHFVTEGIHEALRRARTAAGDRDIRIGGGVDTVRQYLRAGLVDEMHLAFAPILLGGGEHLLHGIDLPAMGFRITEHAASAAAMHVVTARA